MTAKPYITYPEKAATSTSGGATPGTVTPLIYVSEPGKVSFGVLNFVPGLVRSLHHHNTWELIIIDGSSKGPGYVFYDNTWWRADVGSAVFIPPGYPHAWSSGNDNGFKMLWIYGDTREEAGRVYDADARHFPSITPEAEEKARVWTKET